MSDLIVGPGGFTKINDAIFASKPLDRILVSPGTYNEKLVLSNDNINLIGIPDVLGNKPIIDGNNAISGKIRTIFEPNLEDFGVILVTRDLNDPYTKNGKPKNITIDNFDIVGGHQGNNFAAQDGLQRSYAIDSSGIAIYDCENVWVKNCKLRLNGNGIFGRSAGDEVGTLRNIKISNCEFIDNGVIGSDKEHQCYIESAGFIFEGNIIRNLIPGAKGGGLKTRSSGNVIRYNNFEGGARLLDIVDAQEGWPIIGLDPNYNNAFVYRNYFKDQKEDAGYLIHWGGDTQFPIDNTGNYYRYPQGTLYFAHNTVEINVDRIDRWRTIIFDISTNHQSLQSENNIIWVGPSTPGQIPSILKLFNQYGIMNFGKNYVKMGYSIWDQGVLPDQGSLQGQQNIISDNLDLQTVIQNSKNQALPLTPIWEGFNITSKDLGGKGVTDYTLTPPVVIPPPPVAPPVPPVTDLVFPIGLSFDKQIAGKWSNVNATIKLTAPVVGNPIVINITYGGVSARGLTGLTIFEGQISKILQIQTLGMLGRVTITASYNGQSITNSFVIQ